MMLRRCTRVLLLVPTLSLWWALAQDVVMDDDSTCDNDGEGDACDANDADGESCSDGHPMCDIWASNGECVFNAAYMRSACPESCFQCVNVTKLREQGVGEEIM